MNKVLIIGLGLIGGSYAMGLSKKNIEVYAITKNKEDIVYGINNKIIKGGTTIVTKDYLSYFDRIIISLYPKDLIEWLETYAQIIKPGTIITDVTGVKGKIVNKAQEILGDSIEFIGAHPMAGRELSGVKNADNTIFYDANYIITPTIKNTNRGIEFARSIAELLEFKNISILSIEKHDEMIAYLSELTHCIAISLMTSKDDYMNLKDYTGDSFRDLTRIANINEDLWSELFLMNKDELLKSMNLFIDDLEEFRDAIKNEDIDYIKDKMRLSTSRRKFFNK